MASLEVKTNDDDDSCSSSSTQEEFDFIESVREDDVEVGLIIRWPSTQRPLHIVSKNKRKDLFFDAILEVLY